MKANVFALLALVSLVAGCASSTPGLKTYRDDFSGDVNEYTADNQLNVSAPPATDIWLNATRITKPTGVILYYFSVHVEAGGGWLKIDPGETLFISADDEELRYDGIGSEHSRKSAKGGKFVEDAHYKTSSGDLRKIAAAKVVKVRIIGASGNAQAEFGPGNFQNFKDFVAKFLDRGQ